MFPVSFYVYVCVSLKDNRLYTGSTNNLEKRLAEHANGLVTSTKPRLPLKLIYYETYSNETDARMREKYLKGGGRARRNFRLQLSETLKDFDIAKERNKI
ncbi:MAG: GIY-YIG nuclease family protein [Patescibacteria group bacterium]